MQGKGIQHGLDVMKNLVNINKVDLIVIIPVMSHKSPIQLFASINLGPILIPRLGGNPLSNHPSKI